MLTFILMDEYHLSICVSSIYKNKFHYINFRAKNKFKTLI